MISDNDKAATFVGWVPCDRPSAEPPFPLPFADFEYDVNTKLYQCRYCNRPPKSDSREIHGISPRMTDPREYMTALQNAGVAQKVERRTSTAQVARSIRVASSNGHADSTLTGPMRKILTVLAQAGQPCTKRFVALRSGYAINGGAFNNPVGALRSLGYLTRGEPMQITDEGISALGDYDPLPTGTELAQYWLTHLDGPCSKLLSAIIDVWPKAIEKEELAEVTGYTATGGAFNNPLGRLRTLQLIERGQIRASNDLFD